LNFSYNVKFKFKNRKRFEIKRQKKRTAVAVLFVAWRRPALTGGNPQLPSALKSLTAVFGMGTGVTSSLMPPDYVWNKIVPSKLDNFCKVTAIPMPYG
jgi:hypothetical protein